MVHPLGTYEPGFLLPNQPTQAPIFQCVFTGQGAWLTIEVTDVDAEHARLAKSGLPIDVSLRNEARGDRHFSVIDPNGIGVDTVTRILNAP